MFDQIKQMKQALDLQNQLKKEKVSVEKNGVIVVLNATFEVEDIKLNPQLDSQAQEKLLKECFTEANRKLQMRLMELAPQLKSKMGM